MNDILFPASPTWHGLGRLEGVEGPTEADLAAEAEVTESDDWEALLEPVVKVTAQESEDFWNEDENVHDDRYDGDGIPSWSAWA